MSSATVTIVGGGERIPGSSGVRFQGNQIVNTHVVKWMVDAGAFDVSSDPRRVDSYSTRNKILYDNGGVLPLPGITVAPDGSVCISLEAVRHEKNPRYWEVTAEFGQAETKQKAPGGNNPNPNPTTWIPVWEMGYETYEIEEPFDARGYCFRNSQGKTFVPGIRRTHTIVCHDFFQYDLDTIPEDVIADRNGVMNAFDFKGFKKYTLLLTVRSSARGFFNGYPARRTDYTVKYKKGIQGGFKVTPDGTTWNDAPATEYSGWRQMTPDVGPIYVDDGEDKAFRTTGDGQATMANLDGAGNVTGISGGIYDPPALLSYWDFPAVDFHSFLRT